MPSSAGERRRRYEAEVRALAGLAAHYRLKGRSEEQIARELVARRNALKLKIRSEDDAHTLSMIEARNRERYGDPVGPAADGLLEKYGSWTEVIAAASRPAKLS